MPAKAHRPYEFGVKVSIATTVKHSAGGQFVTHAAALPSNPYDGHTLGTVMQALIGNILDRCITDAGYRGHDALPITSSRSTRAARSAASSRCRDLKQVAQHPDESVGPTASAPPAPK
jgi:hypothetical protein